jgi:ADP-ribose pyrophosphatase
MKDDCKILWREIKGSQPVSSTPYFSHVVRNYLLPNGELKKAYISHKRDFVVGLPVTRNGDVVLVREFRPGLERIMLDLPSGSLAEGEEPIVGMERELLEETGYKGTIEFVNRSPTAPFSTQHRNTFVIRDCEIWE